MDKSKELDEVIHDFKEVKYFVLLLEMVKTTHELLKHLTIFHENSSRTLTNTLKRQNSAGISLPSIASNKNSKKGTYDFRDIRRVTAYAFGKRNY